MDTASDKALQRFAELMIEKIQQVEDNWQQPWFSTKGGGLPQNIDGRNYNGVNSFMLFLLTEKEQYGMPVYMTFMQAKEKGLNVLKGEHSFPVVYWNFSIKDKNGKKITMDQYRHLSREEQENYKVTPYMKTYNVFNVNQTNLKEVKPELYEQLENRFKSPALKDEKGMFAMPLLDVMIREGKWVCPILPKEGNQAYYARGEKDGHILQSFPIKCQFIILPHHGPFTQSPLNMQILVRLVIDYTFVWLKLNRFFTYLSLNRPTNERRDTYIILLISFYIERSTQHFH